jgi:IclR family KDG regulon transcriptional repressor
MADTVKSAERALNVVELLTRHPNGCTYTEIAEMLRLPKSSAFALLTTVVGTGFVDFDESSRKYVLGIKAFEAGQTWLASRDLAERAMPYMVRVRDQVNETCQLAVLDGTDNVYLAVAPAQHHLVLQSTIGSRLPAYATGLGKVLLAGLADEELEARLATLQLRPFTPKTIVNKKRLLEKVREARQEGYATDDGEYTPSVACVAVPVRGHTGTVVAAISVSAPDVRRTAGWQARVLKVLTAEAAALSTDLGHARARS